MTALRWDEVAGISRKNTRFRLLEKHDISPKVIKKFRGVIVFIHLGLMTPCYIFFTKICTIE